MINGEWLATVILCMMTVGLILFRYNSPKTESNWPLVYYALAVLHFQMFEGGLDSRILFSAVIAAMLLRFEFMAGWPLKVIHTAEYILLAILAYQLFNIVY